MNITDRRVRPQVDLALRRGVRICRQGIARSRKVVLAAGLLPVWLRTAVARVGVGLDRASQVTIATDHG
jgi:hypothetical protein